MPSRKAFCREAQDRVGTDFVSSVTANGTIGLFKSLKQILGKLRAATSGGTAGAVSCWRRSPSRLEHCSRHGLRH